MVQKQRSASALATRKSPAPVFDLLHALPGRTSSPHTHRAYYRWVDAWLVDHAGLPRTRGDRRIARMRALPLTALCESLTAARLRAWLGWLAQKGQSPASIDQARAAIVTLTQLLVEAGWLEDARGAAVANVRSPKARGERRNARWLSSDEIERLIEAAFHVGKSRNKRMRDHLVLLLLCTMALRREELTRLRLGDFFRHNNRPVLRIRGKGNSVTQMEVPEVLLTLLKDWYLALYKQGKTHPDGLLIRRVWKNGRISEDGLSSEGIRYVVEEAATMAGLGPVAVHDLRRSVAGALQEAGVTVDVISRLLRHGNVAVTERYLSRLPQRNEGGLLMDEILHRDAQ